MTRALACCLLLGSLPLPASEPPDPAPAALDYLQRLRELPADPPDPASLTALHTPVTVEKRAEINRMLTTLAEALRRGGKLAVAETKQDGSLAAVIVTDSPALDPAAGRVHPVTLILRDHTWLPGPVEGSFENLGIDYVPATAAAARRLEGWLAIRVPIHRAGLLRDIAAKTRQNLLDAIPATLPESANPQPWLDTFLKAAESRDLPALMATLGGLEPTPPAGWLESIPRLRKILEETPAKNPYESPPDQPTWATLICNPGPRTNLGWTIDGDTATTELFELQLPLCRRLNRDEGPPVYSANFRLKLGTHWRVDLDSNGDGPVPPVLKPAEPAEADRVLREIAAEHSFDRPATARDLAALAVRSLSLDHPGPLLACIASRPGVDATVWSRLLRLWARTSETGRPPIVLDVFEDGPAACVAWCVTENQSPLIPTGDIAFLRLVRSGDTWSLDPVDPTDPPVTDAAAKWAEDCATRSPAGWFQHLGLNATMAGLVPAPGPDEESARAAITAWATAVTADDLGGILRHSVAFDDDEAIRRLAGVIASELPSNRGLEIIGIHTHERWAAATVRYPPASKDQPSDYLLIPLVRSVGTTRVLAEIIFFEPDSRPRRYLNDRTWKRLASRLPDAAVDELRPLLDAHSKLAEKHREDS